ncbi:T9SS type A sorting domain-containing protein [Flavobacterium aquidurense]|uniref:Pectin or pectate lyase-like protein Polysaccharide lyase family 1 n=1 Tax=Flavobacterium aquidurense TaxID=362413 RepID=A0A0N8VLU4_9FLAO|nr:T9SS type A sorting domain-containing protein [Flavobacterium aquidurense]KQB37492.1 Pectin or pectate lyase-like protein Polysaccharide lyase family 1 [Flavobacterium aquidurense]
MSNSSMKLPFVMALVCLTMSVTTIFAQNPVVKIDFDQSGRPKAEVNEPDYTAWVIGSGNTSTYTENGVTFTVTRAGDKGDALGTNWYKAGIQAPYYARLVCDGLTVKGATANLGAQIELKISGLATGEHTLLTFFNAVDSPTGNNFSSIDISINGNLVVDNLIPSVRATKTADAKSTYLKFQATANTDVVLLFAAETSGTENIKNFILNGFELNTPNIFYQSVNPSPKHNDEHVELGSNGKLLQWTSATNAVSHNIYFGTNPAAVETATTASPEFKGNQIKTNTQYQANGLYTGETYYWRVDEVLAGNAVEKGNIWRFRPAQLAFPDAEGYGRFARGGRGGKVVAVTNLNDSGLGSLRDAVTNDIGPRTIVFNTSGIIQLTSRLVLSQPYVTVAGQTAPGKGICIRSAPFGITGNDAVVQNIRVRVGGGPTYDGMGLTGADNSIIDHCSISWTIDESFSSRSGKNITLQKTLISEALNAAGHQNYPVGTEHGYAATIGGDIGSFHHNLLAHCYGRNWSLGGGLDGSGAYAGKMDITNNVVYNWGSRTTDGGTKEVNFVNNYYKPGAGSKIFTAFNQQNEGAGTGTQQCFFSGNVMPEYFDESNQATGRKASGVTVSFENFVNTPFFPSYVNTQSAKNAYKIVLSDVGCTQPEFDEHDQRIITETLNGTYSFRGSVTNKPGFPDNESDVGGFETYPVLNRDANWDTDQDGLPNWWETIIGTNVNSANGDFSDANADADLDGYTNLDHYLQWMSQPHYESQGGNKININIQKLSRGFTSGVSYSISNVVNGNTVLSSNSVEFTPTASGLCSFNFTVTDAEGGTMTRKVNILSGSATLGIKEMNKENTDSFKVWPVPNNGSFSVLLENDIEKADLKIYDILGKEVLKRTINAKTQENIHLQSKGVFILKVSDPGNKKELYVKKIIVQ